MEKPKVKHRSRMFVDTTIHINLNRTELIKHLKKVEEKLQKSRENKIKYEQHYPK